jgi:hypothetical protein
MTRYVIDFWLDGYDSDQDRWEAEAQYIEESLSATASSVRILSAEKPFEEDLKKQLDRANDLLVTCRYVLPTGDVEEHYHLLKLLMDYIEEYTDR